MGFIKGAYMCKYIHNYKNAKLKNMCGSGLLSLKKNSVGREFYYIFFNGTIVASRMEVQLSLLCMYQI
jgi:hypothetical protein